jgi:hypothetical protein
MTAMTDKTHEPPLKPAEGAGPFSRMLEVDRVPEEGLDLTINADVDERQALADFDEIPAIGRMEAEFHIARRPRGNFNVSGEVRALVTQTCVVSLEPFDSEIVEAIDVDFAPASEGQSTPSAAAGPTEADFEGSDGADPPDPIIDGRIDLGALASEFFALGLDPYPRKPGMEFRPAEVAENPMSPFDVLKKIQGSK